MNAMLKITDAEVVATDRDSQILVLGGVDLEIAPGERVGVIGESGSGKTTLVRSIIGLLRSNSRISRGTIDFEGERVFDADVDRLASLRGRRVAMVFQNPSLSLDPLMRIDAQIREVLTVHGLASRQDARSRSLDLLRDVGFADPERVADSYPHQLSGGMCQRASIAIALASEPDLLIADESTSALDVTSQAEVVQLLRTVSEERRLSMLFVTHDIQLAAELCDRIVVMYGGLIVEDGSTAEVLNDPRHRYTKALLAAVPQWSSRAPLQGIPGAPETLRPGTTGCRFAARCPAVEPVCREDGILFEWTSPTRGYRCLFPVVSA